MSYPEVPGYSESYGGIFEPRPWNPSRGWGGQVAHVGGLDGERHVVAVVAGDAAHVLHLHAAWRHPQRRA